MSTFVRSRHLVTLVTLALLLLALVRPVSAAGPAPTPGLSVHSVAGPAGPLRPPRAALRATGMPGTGVHALGYQPNPAAPPVPPATAATSLATLPTTVDLSQYNPPVANQNSVDLSHPNGVNSCVAWATGYYLRGWYAKRDGYYPAGPDAWGGYAPMYLYSQIVHGQNVATTFSDNFAILQQQGIDTRADYTQGDYDYQDLPTAGETANASHIKIASYSDVRGANLQTWIETSLASGNPVAIGIPIYAAFEFASATNPLVGLPQPGEASLGGHAVFASKYDATGLWIENSWGTGWGLNGWAELSWSFVNQYAFEAVSIAPLSPGGTVPNVLGQAATPAASAIRAAGFNVALAPVADRTCERIGLVMAQSPPWAVYGSTVTLTVGARPPTPCP